LSKQTQQAQKMIIINLFFFTSWMSFFC